MKVVDSHTEGEPTRLVVEGGPDLGGGSLAERRRIFTERFDDLRRFSLNEPRGFSAIVGALLVEPVDPTCAAGLIFYNNAGTLGMCGHGTIGAVVTLGVLDAIGQDAVIDIGIKPPFLYPAGTVAVYGALAVAMAAVAAQIPGWRATRIEPAQALRDQ